MSNICATASIVARYAESRALLISQLLSSHMGCGCLDDVRGAKWYNRIPFLWSVCIKFFIPPVVVLLTFNMITADGFGNYGDFAVGYQIIGMIISFSGLVLVIFGLACPQCFTWLEYQSENDEPDYMIEYSNERRNRMICNATEETVTEEESIEKMSEFEAKPAF